MKESGIALSVKRLGAKLDEKSSFIRIALVASVAMLFMLTIYPALYNVYMSLTDTALFLEKESRFIGLGNYARLLTDPAVRQSAFVSLQYVFIAVLVELLLGFIVAYFLNEESALRDALLVVLILPMAVTPVAVCFTWRIMFNPDIGVINYVLSNVGLPTSKWSSGYDTALLSVVLVDIWQWTSFAALIFLAGLMALPEELLEAARVDGATRAQVLRYVTIPLLRPTIVVVLLLRSLDAFRVFDTIYVITSGGPAHQTETLNILTFLQAFKYFSTGYASALAIAMLVLATIFATIFARQTIMHEDGTN